MCKIENDSRRSKEKKGLKRWLSRCRPCLKVLHSGAWVPVIFPGMKQILGRRDGVLGTLLSKEKSNFLCPIRPIAQNVAALHFSKLLQKRDGLVTISAVAINKQTGIPSRLTRA